MDALFTPDVSDVDLCASAPEDLAAAPRPRARRPAVENTATVHRLEDDEHDSTRPFPVEVEVEIDPEDADWAAHLGLSYMPRSREGADFVRLAPDIFIIPVRGGQILHHDRHLASMEDTAGFSEHTWNLVVEGSEDQLLLVEVDHNLFEHLDLTHGRFIYFNTMNRHLVSRKSPNDTVVLVQVDGFGPDEGKAALERITTVLAGRPSIMPLHQTDL
jgi:hypothetical protein